MRKEFIEREPQELDITTAYALSKVNPNVAIAKRNAKVRRSVVKAFIKFVGKPIEDITPADVEAYKSHLEATG